MQKRLESIRKYLNYSQSDIAKLIGVELRTYQNKEKGTTQFKASEMFLIAREFNMEIEEIFLPPDFIKREVRKEDK